MFGEGKKERKRKGEGEEPDAALFTSEHFLMLNKIINSVSENRGTTEKKGDQSRNISIAIEFINAGV